MPASRIRVSTARPADHDRFCAWNEVYNSSEAHPRHGYFMPADILVAIECRQNWPAFPRCAPLSYLYMILAKEPPLSRVLTDEAKKAVEGTPDMPVADAMTPRKRQRAASSALSPPKRPRQ